MGFCSYSSSSSVYDKPRCNTDKKDLIKHPSEWTKQLASDTVALKLAISGDHDTDEAFKKSNQNLNCRFQVYPTIPEFHPLIRHNPDCNNELRSKYSDKKGIKILMIIWTKTCTNYN